MEFSHDLARGILLKMEELDDPFPSPFEKEHVQILAPDAELRVIYYHIEKLHKAGFLKVLDARSMGAAYVLWPQSLTYQGRQFLDDIRDPSR